MMATQAAPQGRIEMILVPILLVIALVTATAIVVAACGSAHVADELAGRHD